MKDLTIKMQKQFDRMCSTGMLFEANVTGDEVWDKYLNSFENDPKFRDPDSSEHNCKNCKNFIRRYGNIVSINENNEIESIFSNVEQTGEYEKSVQACNKLITSSVIANVFFETYDELNTLPYEKTTKTQTVFKLGIEKNFKIYTKEECEKFGVVKQGVTYTFNHFHLDIPTKFVDKTGKSIGNIKGTYESKFSVFKRAMTEISIDTYILVRDLINQGSLLDGTTHLDSLNKIIEYKTEFDKVSGNVDNWLWKTTYDMNETFAKFKNHLIGVLCSELAEGKELNEACKAWNKRVDPVNYNKAKAPITEAQKKLAEKFVVENGYVESFDRRLATLDDIKASEILHINRDKTSKPVTIFDSIKTPSGVGVHKRSEFDKIEEVNIETFMKDMLPSCTNIELFLENRMEGNLVNLTTSKSECKRIFKWDNPFSYTFNGNLAGKSQLMEMVESRGGRTDGVFRFTHSWNELEPNKSLMDLHVFMPGSKPHDDSSRIQSYSNIGRRIGWNHRNDTLSEGSQDVDYTQMAPSGFIPVENITFPALSKMPEGKYICKVHNWSFRESGGRGKAEIAIGKDIYQYIYPATTNLQWITIAEVTLEKGQFTIDHKIEPINVVSKSMWNLDTNKFHKVNLVCLTPNHWGEDSVGNKHYLFMLEGCKNPNNVRGFHNEHLISDLLQHRKVLDVLGNCALIDPTDNQLAGVGFNATVKDDVILRLSGSFKRTIKIKF